MTTDLLKLLDESRAVYGVMAVALGLLLYRLAGITTLWRHWPVTVLFAGAIAFLACRSPAANESEWVEVIWYAVIWFGGVLGYGLAAKIISRRKRQQRPDTIRAEVSAAPQPPAIGVHVDGRPPIPQEQTRPPKEVQPLPAKAPEAAVEGTSVGARPTPTDTRTQTGPVEDAVARAVSRLWGGRIDEGRLLLQQRCLVAPADPEALAWLAWDCLRPPEDRERSWKSLQQLEKCAPQSSESASVRVVSAFSHRDYDALALAYGQLLAFPAASRFGNYMALFAWLCASDFRYQTQYRPEAMSAMFINSVVKGTAQLLLRQHAAARATFESGCERADDFPAQLSERFELALSAEDRATIATQFRLECLLGQALTDADGGRHDVALKILETAVLPKDEQRIPQHYAGFVRECRNVAASTPLIPPGAVPVSQPLAISPGAGS